MYYAVKWKHKLQSGMYLMILLITICYKKESFCNHIEFVGGFTHAILFIYWENLSDSIIIYNLYVGKKSSKLICEYISKK